MQHALYYDRNLFLPRSTLLPNAVTFGVLGGAASSASAWCAAVRCVERCYKVWMCEGKLLFVGGEVMVDRWMDGWMDG